MITTLFWDIGGVILTNGWDFQARRRAAQKFSFDLDEFETKHTGLEEAFETGTINLDEYMEKTLFFKSRPFDKEDLKAFIFSQSAIDSKTFDIVQYLAHTKKYQMATINNESLDLNIYRIERFHLRDYFRSFFSSSFLGVRKPSGEIYQKVLQITQRDPAECLFIDDRKPNVEAAQAFGISTIHFENANQLHRELELRLEV